MIRFGKTGVNIGSKRRGVAISLQPTPPGRVAGWTWSFNAWWDMKRWLGPVPHWVGLLGCPKAGLVVGTYDRDL